MKRIEAIVRPGRVDAVRAAMVSAGAAGVTVMTATGHGAQGGITQRWRGHDYTVSLLPKTVVMTVVNDADTREVVESIIAAARSGDMGDGKVVVSTVDDAVRVRTGESGYASLA